jgi:hypothetical protein
MTHTGQDRSQILSLPTQQFLLWCLEAFGLRVVSDDSLNYRLQLPEQPPQSPKDASLEQVVGVRFTFDPEQSGVAAGIRECVTTQSPLFTWLRDRLRRSKVPLSAVAAQQPVSVHELTDKLYAPYRVDGGHASLAGCNLEDRPFLRLTYLNPQADSPNRQLKHVFADADGRLLNASLHDDLALHDLKPLPGRSRRVASSVLDEWREVTRQQSESADSHVGELLATTLVWCKYVEAKLSFTIGRQSVELMAEGWAKLFADEQLKPPPYTCPLTGKSSYHLAATDDGQITVADAIVSCDESAKRVLDSELETCAVTGQRVLATYLRNCPISAQPVLHSALERCDMCQQAVSPLTINDGRCSVCRGITPIKKDDPRMARVLGEYPKLDRWKFWRLAEGESIYAMVAASLVKRLLLIVDKSTLEVTRLASGARFSRRWHDADEPLRAEWLERT